MREALAAIVAGRNLTRDQITPVMNGIMAGEATPAQIAALLTALRMKGETVEEVTGAADAMRRHATYIDAGAATVIDTCGTGGDGANTFNISTATAFVAAGAGICVAKHGNRAVSSRCGSADVLAALGVNLDAAPAVMEQCLQEDGIAFLFAPKMHPAMKHVMGPRRELGFRTMFNMLGPLVNPAGATGQVLGVFSAELTEMFAEVLRGLGSRRALVVHGADGLDEITITGPTRVSELRDGTVTTYELHADMLVGNACDPEDLAGGSPEDNAAILKAILTGETGPRLDIVLVNAAAAIVAGEKADSLEQGLELARQSVSSGAALGKLNALVAATQ